MARRKSQHGRGSLERHGRFYRARWVVGGVVYTRSTGTANRREAEKILAEFVAPFLARRRKGWQEYIEARIQGAGEVAAEAKRTSAALALGEAWGSYLASAERPDTGPVTLHDYQIKFGRLVQWLRERHPSVVELRQVTSEMAEEFSTQLARTHSANTHNKYVTFFRHFWLILKEKGDLSENPWIRIRCKSARSVSRRELSVEEVSALYHAATGEMRTLFAVGVYTGLRLGDCATLDWSAVDLDKGTIELEPRKTSRHGTRVMIPIHPFLAEELRRTPNAGTRRGRVLPAISTLYEGEDGQWRLNARIKAVFAKCGIETTEEIGGYAHKIATVGFHSLRHTFVSTCANRGVPMALVQSIVGHTSPAMTRHYYHQSLDALREALLAIPDMPAGGPSPASAPASGGSPAMRAFREAVGQMTGAERSEAAQWLASVLADGAGEMPDEGVQPVKNLSR